MKISLLVVGVTAEAWLQEGIAVYEKRLQHYNISFRIQIIPAVKNASSFTHEKLKEKEGELILKSIAATDVMVLLDEKGTEYTSESFAKYIEKNMLTSVSNMVFVIGGAFGVSEPVKQRANHKIALSQMTFSHQMVRLIFTEQLYRAMSILKNESYHHP